MEVGSAPTENERVPRSVAPFCEHIFPCTGCCSMAVILPLSFSRQYLCMRFNLGISLLWIFIRSSFPRTFMRRLSANSWFLFCFFFNRIEILLLFSMSSLLRTCIGLTLSYLNVLSSSLLSALCAYVLILLQAVSPSSRPGREPGGLGVGERFQEFIEWDRSNYWRFYCRTLKVSLC